MKTKPSQAITLPPYYPYQPGSVIKVEFYPEEAPKDEDQYVYVEHVDKHGAPLPTKPVVLSMKVVKTLSRTFSCVLLVNLIPDPHNAWVSRQLPSSSPMILKLCDRRFSNGLRDDYKAEEWTPSIETEFIAFQALPDDKRPEITVSETFDGDSWYDQSAGGGSDTNIDDAQPNTTTKKIPREKWTHGHREAYLQKWCDKLYDQEVEIYRALAELQGDRVPLLYGTASVLRKNRKGKTTIQTKAMLMEYKSSAFSLRDIPEQILNRDLWQAIGREGIRLVQEIGDMGVLNRDVRLDNILVVPIQRTSSKEPVNPEDQIDELDVSKQFKLVMIDFGLARLQGDDETDEEFRKARRSQDEEGAVGYVLENHLLKHVQGQQKKSNTKCIEKPFNFKHSRRLDRSWDFDEADI